MTEIERIDGEIRRAVQGEAWHGPGTLQIIQDVDARRAAAKPLPGAHSIWELVLHLTGWAREVARRLGGAQAGEPPEGDWPAVADTSDASWERARADLAAAHEELRAAMARLSDAALDTNVKGQEAGSTYRIALHGIAQHDAYHSGQISLLKKAGGSGA